MEIPGVGAMLGPHQGDGSVDLGSNPWIETCPKVCGAAVFGCCWWYIHCFLVLGISLLSWWWYMMIQYMFLIFQNPVWSVCESLPLTFSPPRWTSECFGLCSYWGPTKSVYCIWMYSTHTVCHYIPWYTMIYIYIPLYTITYNYIALYPCYIPTKWLSRNHHLSSWGWLIITSFSLVN